MKDLDLENEAHKVAACYLKLAEYRNQLLEVNQELLQHSPDFAKEYSENEALDTELLEWAEMRERLVDNILVIEGK